MKGTNLGEFEELLMLITASLFPDAYGMSIREEIKVQSGRAVAMGAVHAALTRLEEKGFLKSELASATHERGGRRKRLFAITAEGKKALQTNRELRNQLWDRVPQISWDEAKYVSFEF